MAGAPVLSQRGTGCLSCHFVGGEGPLPDPAAAYKLGPELGNVYKRLRPRWLYEWIADPAVIYPGTVMTQYDYSPLLPEGHPNARRDGADGATEVLMNWLKYYSGN